MKPSKSAAANLLGFLRKSPQFIIPIYQRTYSWTEPQCRQLWDDIMRTGSDDSISGHFIGSIVYIEKGLYQISSQAPLLVIDGQQRLTTVSLIIEALARHLGDGEPIEGFSARKLRNYYLLNPDEACPAGNDTAIMLLTQTDEHDAPCHYRTKGTSRSQLTSGPGQFRTLRGEGQGARREYRTTVQRTGKAHARRHLS